MKFLPLYSEHLSDCLSLEASAGKNPWPESSFKQVFNANKLCYGAFDEHDRLMAIGVLQVVVDEATVLNISVRGEAQNQGLGRRMMEQLITKALDEGCSNMFLEVRESNVSAQNLYLKLGFNEINRRANYYPTHDGQREAAIEMALALGLD